LVCECCDGKCAEQIGMTPQAYEELRAVPAHFAVLPRPRSAGRGEVVARRDGYDVVKKDEGIARRIAEVN
jgi:hypothetical protein